ncbi:MAG TPA: DinB family protein, partial [Thermoanaerobaculia bacterium]|nr:DinB family protein [Thermoanaerobaculia bacterium]
IMYIGLLPDDGLVLQHLHESLSRTIELVRPLTDEQLLHRYAADKWTIKEIVQHITDDERIYAYRALRFARNDATELPGFDEKLFASQSRANARSVDDLLDELATVRAATISLFAGLDDDALTRRGIANGNVMSVRAAAYHIAGHELHHVNVIRERYLDGR